MPDLEIGSKAIDFESVDQNGKRVKLSDMKGRTVVLYFYPKDNTPGCTMEACSFRDDMGILEKAGIEVLGVSTDSQESHKRFEKKHNLNFTLVADPEKKIVEAYGVKGKFGIARRVTYLIDREGTIRHIWSKVSPRGHSAEVLEQAKALGL